MTQEEQQKYIETLTAIFDGKIEAPNEVIAYFCDELRKVRSAMATLTERANQARQQLTQTEQAILEARGAHDKTLADALEWLKRDAGTKTTTATPAVEVTPN